MNPPLSELEPEEPTLRELELDYMAAVMNWLRGEGLLTKEASGDSDPPSSKEVY